MKSGVLAGIYALRILRDLGVPLPTVQYVINTDEETGSATSRALIEETARGADAAYVLEPGRAVGPGCVVTTRKGVGLYTLTVTGRAAHAGGEPWRGRSAILELAHKTIALHALTTPGLRAGVTDGVSVNVGVISRGHAAQRRRGARQSRRSMCAYPQRNSRRKPKRRCKRSPRTRPCRIHTRR